MVQGFENQDLTQSEMKHCTADEMELELNWSQIKHWWLSTKWAMKWAHRMLDQQLVLELEVWHSWLLMGCAVHGSWTLSTAIHPTPWGGVAWGAQPIAWCLSLKPSPMGCRAWAQLYTPHDLNPAPQSHRAVRSWCTALGLGPTALLMVVVHHVHGPRSPPYKGSGSLGPQHC